MELFEVLAKRGALVVLLVLAVVCVLLLGCQRLIMYYPRGYSMERVEDSRALLLRYPLAGEGEQVAFLLGEGKLPDRIWIVCGGNGSVALDWVSFAAQIEAPGIGICLFELPGYGLCEGKADPSSVRDSMVNLRAALAETYSTSVEEIDSRVCFFGHSIGAASALIGAETFSAKRLVLISPFTTMTEMARRSVGWPLCLLNLHRYDNRARLRSLERRGGNAHIFHGIADGVIPVEMSRQLAEEFSGIVKLTEAEGAGHNDVIERTGNAVVEAMR